VIKYLFKFPFIEFNTCNGTDGGDKDDPLCYPRILGIERVTHTSAYDLLLLLALYFHRYSLKVRLFIYVINIFSLVMMAAVRFGS
jgi:hypothetical protein